MEILQTFIAVIIVFAAAFYLLKVSILNKNDKNGCGGCSSENCCACSDVKCSENKGIGISENINKVKH